MDLWPRIKNKAKNILPEEIIRFYTKLNRFFLHVKNKNKSASLVFSEIYSQNLWGGRPGEFYSGPGSEGEYAEQYIDKVNSFIKSLGKDNLCVVDLGCGDFRIGGKIAKENNINYLGVDVVTDLIKRNQNKHSGKSVKFVRLDIASEELPNGDICLVRQVLQHLSNEEIKKILGKLKKYQYIIITESHPFKIKSYNKNKAHGEDMRLFDGSGVYLDKPPFNVGNMNLIMSIPCGREGKIETYLIKNY